MAGESQQDRYDRERREEKAARLTKQAADKKARDDAAAASRKADADRKAANAAKAAAKAAISQPKHPRTPRGGSHRSGRDNTP